MTNQIDLFIILGFVNVINTYLDPRRVYYSSGKLHICTNDPHISTFVLKNPSLRIKYSTLVPVCPDLTLLKLSSHSAHNLNAILQRSMQMGQKNYGKKKLRHLQYTVLISFEVRFQVLP